MDTNIEGIPGVLQQLLADLITFLPNLTVSLVLFILSLYLAGWLSRFLHRRLQKRGVDLEVSRAIETLSRWTVYILGTTMALNQIGFNLTAFLTGIGILGFTIGFAIQDVSKNFVAGLLLLIEQPFKIGDTIEVHGFTGEVLDVVLRATEMRTLDGLIVQIPNADIFTGPITNFTRAERRRISLDVGVAYATELDRARAIALEAILGMEGVLQEPAPVLVYNKFSGSSIDFSLHYWIDTRQTNYLAAQDRGVVSIQQAFAAANIEIPYPIQMVINK